VVRFTMPHVASLQLFVTTPQQQMQVANEKQSAIFEGDPLLLWRLKPNLDRAIWDFTVVSTNAQSFRAAYPIGSKPAGGLRIVCLGDSVTFGYRVPPVWPDKPNDYNRDWLPFPMLLEKELSRANPNKRIEVFPMAVPGYTSHQGLAWLRRDIEKLQPDIVIASFGWNDASSSDMSDRDAIDTRWIPFATRWLIDRSQTFAHATRWVRSRNQTAEL
jgi:lysophospholipase L1-like esterase